LEISKTPQLELKYPLHVFAMLTTHTENVQKFKDKVPKKHLKWFAGLTGLQLTWSEWSVGSF